VGGEEGVRADAGTEEGRAASWSERRWESRNGAPRLRPIGKTKRSLREEGSKLSGLRGVGGLKTGLVYMSIPGGGKDLIFHSAGGRGNS